MWRWWNSVNIFVFFCSSCFLDLFCCLFVNNTFFLTLFEVEKNKIINRKQNCTGVCKDKYRRTEVCYKKENESLHMSKWTRLEQISRIKIGDKVFCMVKLHGREP